MKTVEVKRLSFRYGKKGKLVLNNLNFVCSKGSVNVLIGLNGSGKTTLIKILVGLLEGYDGEVTLNDRELKTLSVKERARTTSYVAQRSASIDDFTVEEYLLFGNVNRMLFYQLPKIEDEKKVYAIAERFGIEYLLKRKLGEISGGERQIVSICGAIVQNTELIVLDEPTSALDIKNQNKVLSFIKEVAEKENKTFILSSHNPNHALYLNADVFLLENGSISEYGKAKDIITVEKLKRIYGDEIVYSKNLDYDEISFCDLRK